MDWFLLIVYRPRVPPLTGQPLHSNRSGSTPPHFFLGVPYSYNDLCCFHNCVRLMSIVEQYNWYTNFEWLFSCISCTRFLKGQIFYLTALNCLYLVADYLIIGVFFSMVYMLCSKLVYTFFLGFPVAPTRSRSYDDFQLLMVEEDPTRRTAGQLEELQT